MHILFGKAPLGFVVGIIVTDVVTTGLVVWAPVEIVVAPTGRVGLLVGRVDAGEAIVEDVAKVVGGANVAIVVTTDVAPTAVVGMPLVLVIPAPVVGIVVPAVPIVVPAVTDGVPVVAGTEVVADVTGEVVGDPDVTGGVVGGPDDARVG